MKKSALLIIFTLMGNSFVHAGIVAGSPSAGFKLSGGDISGGFTLTDGTVRFTSSSSTTGTVTATRSNIIIDEGGANDYTSLYLTGSYAGSSGIITLGSANDRLRIDAGQTQSTIAVNANATIEGIGGFGGQVTVANSTTLYLDMQSSINQDISTSLSGIVQLESDAVFIDGKSIVGTGTIKGNNNSLVYGDGVTLATNQSWNDVTLDLRGGLTVVGDITVDTNACSMIGNGSRVIDGGGSFILGAYNMDWFGVKVYNYSSDFLGTIGTLTLNACSFTTAAGEAVFVDGSITGSSPAIFGSGTTTWGTGTIITLSTNISSNTATWGTALAGAYRINGMGHTLDLKTNVLNVSLAAAYLNDVVLNDVVAGSITGSVPGVSGWLHLSNTKWFDDGGAGAVRIVGSYSGTSAEQAPAAVSLGGGLLFGNDVSFDNGVVMEVLEDITLGANTDWTFVEDSIIEGGGNIIDVSASGAKLHIANGKTLKLRNVIFKGWGANSVDTQVTWDGASGTLDMSEVTILMDGDVILSLGEDLSINGPVTIITRDQSGNDHDFDATANTNAVNGVTVFHDSLGGNGSVDLDVDSGGGRVVPLEENDSTGKTFSINYPDVAKSYFLYHSDTAGAPTWQVELDTSGGSFILDGHGRSFIFNRKAGGASGQCIEVTGGNTVRTNDLVIENFSTDAVTETSGSIRYGNLTTLKMGYDEALTSFLFLASTVGDSVVLDLGGHELDMSSDLAKIVLAEGDIVSTLTIKNGRLMNISDNTSLESKLRVDSTTSPATLVLQDVDIILDGDLNFANAHLTVKGNCSIGSVNRVDSFINNSTGTLTIDTGATLTIKNSVTYEHTGGTSNVTFTDTNSTLALEGGIFTTSGSGAGLSLLHGTLKTDHTSKLNGTMTLGGATTNELHLDVMPAAKIDLANGLVTYSNP